ncbi:MAG: efflux RND transporter periplasmic adaptor subunit [Sedimentisphaerales bacterium]|nr:efflux RND transporter periplasmic adaptor subunit [Sedimentisphaerales bacterium]
MSAKPHAESDIAKTLGVADGAGRRRRLKRWLVPLLLIVALVGFLALRKSPGGSKVVQYKTQEAKRGDLVVRVTATGTLEPTNEVEVGSEISGIVKAVEADYNDEVRVGQVLARIDTSKYEAQETQLKAALESAQARVLQAKATLNETQTKLAQLQRVRELSDGKVPSQTEFDAAQAALERAKADDASAAAAVAQAQATLKATQTDIAKAVIRSPIDGVVLTRQIEPGQTVAAAFQAPVLFTLAEDLTQMELHVDVDEADIGQVGDGQEAEFTVAAYLDRTFKAKIVQTRFGSQTVDGVVTYETVLKVDNTDLALRPGMTATADITVQKVENALLVPNAALRFSPPMQGQKRASRGLVGMMLPGPPRFNAPQEAVVDTNKRQQTLWVLKDGLPTAVPVTIGVSDGAMTEVVSGDIQPGTPVVVDTMATGR